MFEVSFFCCCHICWQPEMKQMQQYRAVLHIRLPQSHSRTCACREVRGPRVCGPLSGSGGNGRHRAVLGYRREPRPAPQPPDFNSPSTGEVRKPPSTADPQPGGIRIQPGLGTRIPETGPAPRATAGLTGARLAHLRRLWIFH